MTALARRNPPLNTQEAAQARASSQNLSRLLRRNRPIILTLADAGEKQTVELPQGVAPLLLTILEAMAAGRRATGMTEDAELTTIQAAEMLHVSRPFLIKLLDAKTLPYRKVGAHRRVRAEDVIAYKKRIDLEREAILDQLASEAQENGMGYSRI